MRKREWVWIGITLLLAGAWAGKDVDPEIVAERQAQISHASQYPEVLRLSHPLPCDATMKVSSGLQTYQDECYRRTNVNQ